MTSGKKRVLIFSLVAIALIAILGAFFAFNLRNQTFYLDDAAYGQAKMQEITAVELDQIVNDQASFLLFVYQPACVTSANFEENLTQVLEEKSLSVYKIAFSDLKDTKLSDRIDYYPSFAIFHHGKLIDFLKPDQDEDTPRFENKDDFIKWLTTYIKIKPASSTTIEIDSGSNSDHSASKADLSQIKQTNGKVNIYFFWGDGCPHCASEKAFFQEIEQEYGKYYNIYLFETWYNDDNADLMKTFASAMGEEAKGVPYTIIGNQSFIGFPENYKEEMKEAIKNSTAANHDIYFDKVKPILDAEKSSSNQSDE